MKKLSKKAKMLIVVLIIAAVAVGICIYLFFGKSSYYETHFFMGTYINGYDVSDMTAQEVKDQLQAEIDEYALTIYERDDVTESITAVQLGFTYVDDGAVDEILEAQDGNDWYTQMNVTKEYEVSAEYTYDDAVITELVDALSCFDEANIVQPKDAYIELAENEFVIVSEENGNELDKEEVYGIIAAAVKNEEPSVDFEELGLYAGPEVTSEDEALNEELDAYNLMVSACITYDFVDRQWVVDNDELVSWVIQNEDGSYDLSYDEIYAWVAEMSYETDTFGLARTFMTTYGVEIQLEGGGDYGWCMQRTLTAEHLYEYLISGSVASIDPDYVYVGKDRSKNDIGDTYVEICISTQTMWFYYQGELLVETPVITGCVEKGYSTPSGSVWSIDMRRTNWTFTTFANSYCDYWMPFNGDVGIHDASWQAASSYVATTYLTAGSHGCVNTPYEAVKTIYEYVEVGTPVIVYYSTDEVHGPDPTQELEAGE